MKKYYTDRRGVIILGALVFLLVVGSSIPKYPDPNAIKSDILFSVVWTFILLITSIYSYASITGSTLKFVYILFIRRTININLITEIKDSATYRIAKSQFRSLYIFYKDKNDGVKWIELRITIFPEKTLGKLIKDLKSINPNIELNNYS